MCYRVLGICGVSCSRSRRVCVTIPEPALYTFIIQPYSRQTQACYPPFFPYRKGNVNSSVPGDKWLTGTSFALSVVGILLQEKQIYSRSTNVFAYSTFDLHLDRVDAQSLWNRFLARPKKQKIRNLVTIAPLHVEYRDLSTTPLHCVHVRSRRVHLSNFLVNTFRGKLSRFGRSPWMRYRPQYTDRPA